MDYVTVRELRAESAKVWDRVEAGEEIVITRNGKPFALLLGTKPSEVEEALRTHRAARFGAVLDRIHAHVRAHGLDTISDAAIAAEIEAVRAPRRAAMQASMSPKKAVKPVPRTHAKPGRR